MSVLIERYKDYHGRYPWHTRKSDLTYYSQPALFQYWAFKRYRDDNGIVRDDDDK
jgi:hypothetical protein